MFPLPRLFLTLILSAFLAGAARAECLLLEANGVIAGGDLSANGIVATTSSPSDCAPTAFPGTNDPYSHRYKTHTWTNSTGSAMCVDITTRAVGRDPVATSAYLDAFNPANLAANFLGHGGNRAFSERLSSFGVTVPAGASLVIVVAEGATGQGASYNLRIACAETPLPKGSILINEYRLRGAAGALDEYVSLYNNTDAPITTGAAWTLFSSRFSYDYQPIVTIPQGLVIPARGSLLLANTLGFSLTGYPGGAGDTMPDVTWTTDIPDGAGLGLFRRPAVRPEFVMDAVGYANADALCREGAGFPSTTSDERSGTPQYAFVRRVVNGVPRDTDNNLLDFRSVEPAGMQTAAGGHIGAPGPRGLASPIPAKGGYLNTTGPLDPAVPFDAEPNALRITTPVTNGPLGTYELLRAVTNTSDTPVTRLRFRISELSTRGEAVGLPVLRALSSAARTVTRADGSSVTALATTLEEPPRQLLGGGVNSSLSVPSVSPASPLLPGATIYVALRFGVLQDWSTNLPAIDFVPETLGGVLTAQSNQPPAILTAPVMAVRAGGGKSHPVAVVDPDAGNGNLRVTARVSRGKLSFSNPSGLTLLAGGSHGGALFTVQGRGADLNLGLATLSYRPDVGFTGTDRLMITVNDLGASGPGGPRETSVTIPIHVANDASVLAIAGGLAQANPDDVALFDHPVDGRLTIVDAVRLARSPGNPSAGRVTASTDTRFVAGGIYIDDPAINGRPGARVMVMHNFRNAYIRSPLTTLYDAPTERWTIRTENGAAIRDGEQFFYAFDGPLQSVARPDAGNPYGHATRLTTSISAGASAPVLAQHQATGGAWDKPLGVWYASKAWYVYDEDLAVQPGGLTFIYANPGAAGGRITRGASNAFSTYGVYLDDARLNGRPDAVVIAQHLYEVVYVNCAMGVWYDAAAGKWVAYNEDVAIPFPNGESVNYWVVK